MEHRCVHCTIHSNTSRVVRKTKVQTMKNWEPTLDEGGRPAKHHHEIQRTHIFFFLTRCFDRRCSVARTVLPVSLRALDTRLAIYILAAPGCAQERAKSKWVSLGREWEGGGLVTSARISLMELVTANLVVTNISLIWMISLDLFL